MLFLGGTDTHVAHSSTEIYNSSTGIFSPGVNLMNDVPRHGACAVKLAVDSFILLGGDTDSIKDKAFMKYDLGSGSWTDLPKPSVARTGAICGYLSLIHI